MTLALHRNYHNTNANLPVLLLDLVAATVVGAGRLVATGFVGNTRVRDETALIPTLMDDTASITNKTMTLRMINSNLRQRSVYV